MGVLDDVDAVAVEGVADESRPARPGLAEDARRHVVVVVAAAHVRVPAARVEQLVCRRIPALAVEGVVQVHPVVEHPDRAAGRAVRAGGCARVERQAPALLPGADPVRVVVVGVGGVADRDREDPGRVIGGQVVEGDQAPCADDPETEERVWPVDGAVDAQLGRLVPGAGRLIDPGPVEGCASCRGEAGAADVDVADPRSRAEVPVTKGNGAQIEGAGGRGGRARACRIDLERARGEEHDRQAGGEHGAWPAPPLRRARGGAGVQRTAGQVR